MDPNATWQALSQAVADADWGKAGELADGLLHWLSRDGFPPNISGLPLFDKIVAKATCEAIAAWEVAV